MLKYIIKRILISILILFGVSVIIYALVRMMPGDYVTQKLASQISQGTVSQEDIDRFKALYGLSDSSFWGILKGYFGWLGNMLRGDLGNSFVYDGTPVGTVIFEHMGISFAIAFVSMIIEYIIAIPLGIRSATHQYGPLDYTITVLAMMGIALPSFFLGTLLIRIFYVDLGILPGGGMHTAGMDFTGFGRFLDSVKHLILPVGAFIILGVGGTMRFMRTNTLEVLNADYIRTARAKGLSEGRVVYKHVFRNTLIPLVTAFAGILPGMFGGAMITEEIFALDGIGRIAYKALNSADIPFIMGYNMFLAVLTVIGTFLSDIAYGLVDPRVKITK
jgi:peptide/nickel transport system permease protein